MWQRLLDEIPGDMELIDIGREWLQGREDKAEWSHVWRKLLDKMPGDPELIKIGREWLPGQENKVEYGYVVRYLKIHQDRWRYGNS